MRTLAWPSASNPQSLKLCGRQPLKRFERVVQAAVNSGQPFKKKKIPPPGPNRVFLLLIGEAHFRWGQARAFLFFGLGPNPFQVGTPHRSRSINDSVQGRPANPSDFSSGTVLTNQVPTRPARQHHRQATISKDHVPTPEARHELCFAVLCLSALLSLHDIGMGLCLVLL